MDQDDSMLSTPSSNNDIDESLITNPNDDDEDVNISGQQEQQPITTSLNVRPHTPQNDHLNAAAPGELSPPRSQANIHNTDVLMRQIDEDDDIDRSPTNPNLGVVAGSTSGVGIASSIGTGAGSTAAQADGGEWRAGQGWKNKKAQTEMHKAWETFSDRDFTLKPFGDFLAHRIGAESGRK